MSEYIYEDEQVQADAERLGVTEEQIHEALSNDPQTNGCPARVLDGAGYPFGYYCCRLKDHDGPHIAVDTEETILEVWEEE